MPRKSRVIIPGVAHHITQRGNNRQKVFFHKKDFIRYCYWFNKYASKYKVDVLAYCLMPNHVHFVVIPQDESGISRLFNTVHMLYAQHINSKKKQSGHLWQGRFFSCILDNHHLYYAIRYVEQNPVRARISSYPWNYSWSSARWHVKETVENYIKTKSTDLIAKRDWKRYLTNNDMDMDDQIRKVTRTGKAVAKEEFIMHWEKKLACILRNLKPGRHRK